MQNEKKVKKTNEAKTGFVHSSKSELKKVIWPTGKQTMKSTAVTIGFVFLISVILIVLNIAFDFLSDKAYDLLLGTDKDNEVVEVVSGDVSGEVSKEISGDVVTSGDAEVVE